MTTWSNHKASQEPPNPRFWHDGCYDVREDLRELIQSAVRQCVGHGGPTHASEVMVENLANSETTRTPSGGPYRAKEVIFESAAQSSPFASILQQEMAGTGVKVGAIMEDMGEPEKRFIPGHPDADKDGYVAFPRINPAMDMADMMSAMRGYESNVAAMGLVKDMISKTIDLIKS